MNTAKTLVVLGLIVLFASFALAQGSVTLLNVSYDPTRELYQGYNAAFAAKCWQAKSGQAVIRPAVSWRVGQTGARRHRWPAGRRGDACAGLRY